MSDEDEMQVRRMLDEFGAAINARDPAAIGRFWLEEGNFVDQWGRLAIGRAGVEEFFAREFDSAFSESRFRALRLDLRSLSEDTMVGECEAVFENVKAPNDRAYDLPHRIDAIFVRRGGRWRFMSAHPSFRRA